MIRVMLFGTVEQIDTMKKALRDPFSLQFAEDLCGCSEIKIYHDVVKTTNSVVVFADSIQKDIFMNCVCNNEFDFKNIVYAEYKDVTLDEPLEKVPDDETDVLLLGMSHLQCGVDESLYKNHHIFKMAAPSMDLFLHLNYSRKFASMYNQVSKHIKTIIIELPYYIFNYDLSQFGDFTRTKLIYFDTINNYHHFGINEEQKQTIERYKLYKSLFLPIKEHTGALKKSESSIKKFIRHYVNDYRITQNRDKVWTHKYLGTIEENKTLFIELLTSLMTFYPDATIKILVMPFNPVFIRSHKTCITEMKSIFYDCMKGTDLVIVDDFGYFKSSWYFNDHCHLNENGLLKYSEQFGKHL